MNFISLSFDWLYRRFFLVLFGFLFIPLFSQAPEKCSKDFGNFPRPLSKVSLFKSCFK